MSYGFVGIRLRGAFPHLLDVQSWLDCWVTFDDIPLANLDVANLSQSLLDAKIRSWQLVVKKGSGFDVPYVHLGSSMTLMERIEEKKIK